MNKGQKVIVGAAILVLLIGAATFFAVSTRPPVPQAASPEKVVASDHTMGDATARVVMIEYG